MSTTDPDDGLTDAQRRQATRDGHAGAAILAEIDRIAHERDDVWTIGGREALRFVQAVRRADREMDGH